MPIVRVYDEASGLWKAASGMPDIMTESGSIIIGGSSGTPTELIKGSDGQVLTMANDLPTWADNYDEIVVTSNPTTTVTFSDLDGNAAGGYLLVCEFTPAVSTDCTVYLHCNNDVTNTNYIGVGVSIGDAGTIGVVRATSRNIIGSFSTTYPISFSVTEIGLANNKICWGSELVYRNTTVPAYLSSKIIHNSTQTNITSLGILSNIANSIGIGSVFRLYRRK